MYKGLSVIFKVVHTEVLTDQATGFILSPDVHLSKRLEFTVYASSSPALLAPFRLGSSAIVGLRPRSLYYR